MNQTHISSREADIIDKPVAHMDKIEIKGDKEEAGHQISQEHLFIVRITFKFLKIENVKQLFKVGTIFVWFGCRRVFH